VGNYKFDCLSFKEEKKSQNKVITNEGAKDFFPLNIFSEGEFFL